MTVLAYNLQVLLQRDFSRLGTRPLARMKWLRFKFICLAGPVVKHARPWIIRVPADHPGLEAIHTMKDMIETRHGRDPPDPWLKSAARGPAFTRVWCGWRSSAQPEKRLQRDVWPVFSPVWA